MRTISLPPEVPPVLREHVDFAGRRAVEEDHGAFHGHRNQGVNVAVETTTGEVGCRGGPCG